MITEDDINQHKTGQLWTEVEFPDGTKKFQWEYPKDLGLAYGKLLSFCFDLQERIIYLESFLGTSIYCPDELKKLVQEKGKSKDQLK